MYLVTIHIDNFDLHIKQRAKGMEACYKLVSFYLGVADYTTPIPLKVG